MKIAVLDDYQGVTLQMADWSAIQRQAEVAVFRDHFSDQDAVAARLKPFDIICAMRERTPFPKALLEQLPNLKLLVSTGARNASIDMEAAKALGITVQGTGYVPHGAAELTWALILAAAKRIPQESAAVRSGGWQTSIGLDLKGSTLGILGLGKLGSTIARYAKAFEMNVLAWSPNLTEEKAQAAGAHLVSKEQLFRDSDMVTVHVVLSDRSRGMIGTAELQSMKPTAWLVNTSRGPLVDEAALIQVLETHKIAGAALDVFDQEPLPIDHPFRTMSNVLTTPHIGFVTEQTYKVFYGDTVTIILQWLETNQ